MTVDLSSPSSSCNQEQQWRAKVLEAGMAPGRCDEVEPLWASSEGPQTPAKRAFALEKAQGAAPATAAIRRTGQARTMAIVGLGVV